MMETQTSGPFDTHAAVKSLLAAGVPEQQAEQHVTLLRQAVLGNVATRDQLALAEQALKGEITALRSDVEKMQQTIRSDMQALGTALKLQLGGMMVGIVGFFYVMERFF